MDANRTTLDEKRKTKDERGKAVSFVFRLSSFASILPLAFLGVFFLYPLAAILRLSLSAGGILSIASDPYYLRVVGFSAWLGALSTVLTLAFGLPGAFVLARFQFRGKTVLRALATVPFVLPTVVVAAAFGELLGPRGLLNSLLEHVIGYAPIQLNRTIWLVLLAHVFYNYSIVLRIVGGFWESLDVRLEQAAAVLGANRWRVFREVTLPLLLPAVGSAALLVFIFCFTSFGIVLILGGPTMATVEVEIYRQTAQLLRLDIAGVLALLQMLVTLVMTLLYTRLQEHANVVIAARAPTSNTRQPRTAGEHLLLATNISVIVLLIGMPLFALALRSITTSDGMFTLNFYQLLAANTARSLFIVPPLVAVRNSLLFAAATVVLALLVGVSGAYLLNRRRTKDERRRPNRLLSSFVFRLSSLLDALFTLPLGSSAVTLALGYIITFGALGVLQSPLMVPVAHTLLAFPLVVRGVLPALRALDPRMREAARTLGAGPLRVFWQVDMPLLAPALLVGAVYAFTVSLGDFGAVLLLGQAEFPTVPIVIFRLLGRPGATNYGQAMALCTILMVVSAACFLVLERARPPRSEF